MPINYQSQLDAVNAAIAKAEQGQTVEFGDRKVQRGALPAMYAERERLERMVARQSLGRRGVRRGVPE